MSDVCDKVKLWQQVCVWFFTFLDGLQSTENVFNKWFYFKSNLGISININGRAYCRWVEGTGDSKKTYIGEEDYLSEKTFLIGDKTGK